MIDHPHEKLISLIRQFLIDSGINNQTELKLDSSLQRHLGIDSLMRAELFHRIEREFQLEMPDRLLIEIDTLRDLIRYLQQADPLHSTVTAHDVYTHEERPHLDLKQTETLLEVLYLYAKQAPAKAHIYFQHEDGQQEVITYGALLQSALQIAEGLQQIGLRQGETVALMLPTEPGFFYAFYGILLAGGIPVPIYPPFRMHMLEVYAKTEAHILRSAEVRYLITFSKAERLSRLLQTFVPTLKRVVTINDIFQPKTLLTPYQAKSSDFAFIQYTSGSTSQPKGVLLTHANLLANIRAFGEAIQVTNQDVVVSWLPLYHDMGLIGMWLGSLYFGAPLVLMTPFSFLNHPEKWLWAIHQHRGTISAAPNFAYDLCVRKIDPSCLEGLDLSSWRVAANGAEKIYARTLQQFAERFSPYGFNAHALLAVYGLAESTVGLAIPPLQRGIRLDVIDRKIFEEKKLAIPSAEKDTLTFVACGRAIPRHEIRIVDDELKILSERQVGRLQFRGPSSMQGYYNNPTATAAIYHDGWWDSGDLAYLAEGEVYLTGRRKDLIIKAGRNLYPTEIEELVGNISAVRQGCVVAFAVEDEKTATERLIVVAETREKNPISHERILADITDKMAADLDISPDEIILVPPHKVPKTSSGKLQRAACKHLYLTHQLKKSPQSAWWQVVKLFFSSGWNKLKRGIVYVLKFIYTVYFIILVGCVFISIYALVRFTQRSIAISIIRLAAKFILVAAFCPVKIVRAEGLDQSPIIYVANHASYLDALVMLAILPVDTRLVGKMELFNLPIIGAILKKLDYLAIDRKDFLQGVEDTKKMEAVLRAGHSIMLFPEGTFGYTAGLRPFRLGAFKLAAETHIPICPLAINGTRNAWRGDDKLLKPANITVTVLELIFPSGEQWPEVTSLRHKAREEIAKYCGEPSLDFIVAQTIAPKPQDWDQKT